MTKPWNSQELQKIIGDFTVEIENRPGN